MAYTDIDKPSDYFNTKLFTGNGSTNAITGVGFQPDWIWFKNRTSAQSHAIVDSVRGRKGLISNGTNAEFNLTAGREFGTFDSDGFTVLNPEQLNSFNYNTGSIVSWNWKAGTSFTNDASATGIGTIDSTGSVNTDAGFSICTYTGTGSAGTIKHGLNKKPTFWMTKARSETRAWYGWHQGFALGSVVNFNSTNAASSDSSLFSTTAPTSSVYNVGTSPGTNNNGITFVNYLFHDVAGYSKFGSYVGNGNADGTFVYTGFKPAFVMVKSTGGESNWQMSDNKRNTFNEVNKHLRANSNGAEFTNYPIDFLSNGFKLRATDTDTNGSGTTYIFMAFAEESFVSSTGVPATAR